MQNVPQNEQQQFRLVTDALASPKSGMRDSVKVLNLGLMLMNVVGTEVLSAAVRTLGEKIQGPAKLELDVFVKIQGIPFDRAYPTLVDMCFIMSRYGSAVEQEAAKKAVVTELAPLKDKRDLDDSTKMIFLALSLQQRVGDSVLLAALAHLGNSMRTELKKPEQAAPDTSTPASEVPGALAPTGTDPEGVVVPIRPSEGGDGHTAE
jgi:hypothetical protein